MVKFKCDGREIELRFTMASYEMIEQSFGSYEAMEKARTDRKKGMDTMVELAAIFANSACEYHEEEPKYTKKWLLAHCRPIDMKGLVKAVENAFREGMGMEVREEANDKPRDLVLEELEKKTTAD